MPVNWNGFYNRVVRGVAYSTFVILILLTLGNHAGQTLPLQRGFTPTSPLETAVWQGAQALTLPAHAAIQPAEAAGLAMPLPGAQEGIDAVTPPMNAVAIGNNDFGQCDVSGWSNIIALAVGGYHTLGLRSAGTVAATGHALYGQCNVAGWTGIADIAAGGFHSLGLSANGMVVATGETTYGQCNVAGWTNVTALAAGNRHSVAVRTDKTVVAVGDNTYGQCNITAWTNIKAIAAGHWHTVGLRTDNTVLATGDNVEGQCNVGAWKDIVAVAAGHQHTLGLRADGTVVATGDNADGQCNVGEWTNVVAIAAGQWHSIALRADGTVLATGETYDGQIDVVGLRNGAAVGGGYNHTVLLTNVPHYLVTGRAGPNGGISPPSPQTVAHGASVAFTASPDAEYMVQQWLVDEEVAQIGGNIFTLTDVTANAVVTVSFTEKSQTWTVTPRSGANGSIAPDAAQSVVHGESITFTATPQTNYLVETWTVDGAVAQQGGNTFTLTNVIADAEVGVTFILRSWTVTPHSGANGSIAPDSAQSVVHGADISFTATPQANYLVESWTVDGAMAQQGGNTFTLTNVTADAEVGVTFILRSWIVTPRSGANGSIAPDAAQSVVHGANISFTATPQTNYQVESWTVDGALAQQGGSTFTLTNVIADAEVGVTFILRSWIVTPRSGANGSIAPDAAQSVVHGADITFTATPQTNYQLESWTVDDVVAQQGGNTFTLTNVTADAEVGVTFTLRTWIVTPRSGANGNIAPETPQAVPHGNNVTFTALPLTDYQVEHWTVDGVITQVGGTEFVLNNVVADATVQVFFVRSPLRSVTLIASSNPVLIGTQITLTAVPTGGRQIEYQFYRRVGNSWESLTGGLYRAEPIVNWMPIASGSQLFRVNAREVGTTAFLPGEVTVTVNAPLNAVTLVGAPVPNFLGTPITLLAIPSGGLNVEYQFYRRVDNSWESLTDGQYRPLAICSWLPASTGSYLFRVNAREVGSTNFVPGEVTMTVNSILSGVAVAATPNPAFLGNQITLTAAPYGGGLVEYQFYRRTGSSWESLTGGKYLASRTCNWTPVVPGPQLFRVNAREVGTPGYFPAEVTVAVNERLTGVAVTAAPEPAFFGNQLTLTAIPAGGGAVEYQFYRRVGSAWESLTGDQYLPGRTCTWMANSLGAQRIRVNAREVGTKVYFPGEVVVTVSAPLTGVNVAASPLPPFLAQPITLTASPIGGHAVEYQFYRRLATGWESLTGGQYLPARSCTWTPTTTGAQLIRVNAREMGTTTYFPGEVIVTVNAPLNGVSVIAAPSPTFLGNQITLTAAPSGGATVEFQFYRRVGSVWESLTGGKYQSDRTCTWIADTLGPQRFRVNAREVGKSAYLPGEVVVTVFPLLSGANLVAIPSPTLVGNQIALTAIPTGGAKLEYQFFRREGASWVSITAGRYRPERTISWTPTEPGSYRFRVNIREVGTLQYFPAEVTISVNAPLNGVQLLAVPTPVATDQPLLLFATASGGGTVEYQFFRRVGAAWVSLTGGKYMAANSCTWNPAAPGSELLRVNAREVGTTTYFVAEVTVTVYTP